MFFSHDVMDAAALVPGSPPPPLFPFLFSLGQSLLSSDWLEFFLCQVRLSDLQNSGASVMFCLGCWLL